MTREAFIRKWLANPQKQYNEQCRDEMRYDLDVIQTESYNQALDDLMNEIEKSSFTGDLKETIRQMTQILKKETYEQPIKKV